MGRGCKGEPVVPPYAVMVFHPEVMPAVQRTVLRRVGVVATEREFYLAGGTAVALHLGHRESVDLDWFTPGSVDEPLALAAELRRSGMVFDVTGVEQGTLHGTMEGVKLSFLEYRYPSVAPAVAWEEYGCRLASLEDLACMKLSAIGSRGAKRDFIDICALGRSHVPIDRMLGFYRQKFGIEDVGHALAALTYFDDAEEERMPRMHWDVEWEEIKRTLEGWVREYLDNPSPPA